jgi:FkbM family methyltransferase
MKIFNKAIRNIFDVLGYSIIKKQEETAEAKETREIKEFVERNKWLQDFAIQTILDIGANEGQFAKKISSLFPTAQLHCFEPISGPFQKLKHNFQHNSNVTLHQFALGEVEENRIINLNEYSPSSSFLNMEENHKKSFDFAINTTACDVNIKRLDSLDLKLKGPILIKIDVQGFEDKVIAGGVDFIKSASIIIIEVTFKPLYEKQPMFDNIYQTLTLLGFSYNGNFEQLLSPVTGEILQGDAIFINNL